VTLTCRGAVRIRGSVELRRRERERAGVEAYRTGRWWDSLHRGSMNGHCVYLGGKCGVGGGKKKVFFLGRCGVGGVENGSKNGDRGDRRKEEALDESVEERTRTVEGLDTAG